MDDHKWLGHLERIHWFDEPESPTVLSGRGLVYGFSAYQSTHPTRLWYARQVHGTDIVDARELAAGRACEADGVFLQGMAGTITVKTADCLPIILAAPTAQALCLVHAGWRGLSGGILAAALDKMASHGVEAADVYAVLGPTISSRRFEVGPEVVAAFADARLGLKPHELALSLQKGRRDRWHVDLTQAAIFTLLGRGVSPDQISALRSCTFENRELWPSFRRDGTTNPAIWTWAALA